MLKDEKASQQEADLISDGNLKLIDFNPVPEPSGNYLANKYEVVAEILDLPNLYEKRAKLFAKNNSIKFDAAFHDE